ncbi:hypothetical protein [Bradyrhizobium sp. Bra64]|uniref:hypothetical protein n=1 Tax=Bradyrhizobium sp. Bra64 TaxID=2926009 RepID=UPI002118058C|nr:hypothetical protein [Bradyrhizobium sp. Bra64]
MPTADAPIAYPSTTNWTFVSRLVLISSSGAIARIERPVPSWIRKNTNVKSNVFIHIAVSLEFFRLSQEDA